LSVPVTLLLPDNQLSEIVAKLYKTNNIVIPWKSLCRNPNLSLRNASQALWQS